MSPVESCIFCKIIKGVIPSCKVYETPNVLAFLDINPLAKGHTLIIPKHHSQFLHQQPDDSLAHLLPAVKKVAQALGTDSYNVLQNNGRLAHQAVDHVHFHVIPKPDEESGLGIRWPSQNPSKEELVQTAADIAAKIEKL